MAGPLIVNLSLTPPPPSTPPSRSSPSSSSCLSSTHSLATHCDSLPSDYNGHGCWSSNSATRLSRIRVTMGPCRWKYCTCPQGTCVTTSSSQAGNCECGHSMADHEDYGKFPLLLICTASNFCRPSATQEPTAMPALPAPVRVPPGRIFEEPGAYLYVEICSRIKPNAYRCCHARR